MQFDAKTIWMEVPRWIPDDEDDYEEERQHVIEEKFFAPQGQEWPLYSVALYQVPTEAGLLEPQYVVSIDFKASPEAWWHRAGMIEGGAPRAIIQEMGRLIHRRIPESGQ
jgi:hypothetical protein